MMRAVSAFAAPGSNRASRRSTRMRNSCRISACDDTRGEDSIAKDLRRPTFTEHVRIPRDPLGSGQLEADALPVPCRALADVVSWSRPTQANNAPATTGANFKGDANEHQNHNRANDRRRVCGSRNARPRPRPNGHTLRYRDVRGS